MNHGKQAGQFHYNPLDVLGTGSWGTVYKARHAQGGQQWYALKKINKYKIQANEGCLEKYRQEVLSLQKGHQISQVIKFVDFFKSQSNYYIVTEYQEGSQDLLAYLKANPGKFTELQARILWYDLLTGVQELHNLKITHRDLKLQNILYVPEKKKAMIIDFGLAINFQEAGGRVGSLLFMSPQVISNQPYSHKCDTWSLGIIFYWMICRCSPYGNNPTPDSILNIMEKLEMGQIPIPNNMYMSDQCQQVIRGCLRWEEKDRMQIEDILGLNFFHFPKPQHLKKNLEWYQPKLNFTD